ncbi:hypothetical protein [Streptomyces sp. x-45]|uniref:hypothetical protein n=1 Tax=Streptomyces sp. x-45 TaxID=2789281 RepID=UPI00397F6D24
MDVDCTFHRNWHTSSATFVIKPLIAGGWIKWQTLAPGSFPGQSPARPLRAEYLSLKFRDYGLSGLAGRNTARLALAANLPASVLADLTGTSVDNAVRWTKFAKRDWTEYVAARKRDTQN